MRRCLPAVEGFTWLQMQVPELWASGWVQSHAVTLREEGPWRAAALTSRSLMPAHLHHKDVMPGCWLPCPDTSAFVPRSCSRRAEAGAQDFRTSLKNACSHAAHKKATWSHFVCPGRISSSLGASQACYVPATGLGTACGTRVLVCYLQDSCEVHSASAGRQAVLHHHAQPAAVRAAALGAPPRL